MRNEVGAPLEAFPAHGAFIQVPFHMDALMFDQIGAGTKGFPTVQTLEWLHSGVDSLMDREVGTLGEGFPAGLAFKGPLSSVGPLVNDKVSFSNKRFPTVRASMGLPSCVASFVGDIMRDHLKVPPSIGACQQLLLWVGTVLLNQTRPLPELEAVHLVGFFLFLCRDFFLSPGPIEGLVTLPKDGGFCSLLRVASPLLLSSLPTLWTVVLLSKAGSALFCSPPLCSPV